MRLCGGGALERLNQRRQCSRVIRTETWTALVAVPMDVPRAVAGVVNALHHGADRRNANAGADILIVAHLVVRVSDGHEVNGEDERFAIHARATPSEH